MSKARVVVLEVISGHHTVTQAARVMACRASTSIDCWPATAKAVLSLSTRVHGAPPATLGPSAGLGRPSFV